MFPTGGGLILLDMGTIRFLPDIELFKKPGRGAAAFLGRGGKAAPERGETMLGPGIFEEAADVE